MKGLLVILVPVLFFISSCTSDDARGDAKIRTTKSVDTKSIWFDYRVTGDEESGDIIIKLQYRLDGPSGNSLFLAEPSKVEFDGESINPDSSKMSGAYYEIIRPAADFEGNHIIVFTDINGKEYKEEFSFQPVSLNTELPEIVERDDLVLEFDGLNSGDYITIMLNDTAAFSEGVNRVDTVKDGRIIIKRYELEELADGPIRLDILKERERRVKSRTATGGKLAVSYTLKREFELR